MCIRDSLRTDQSEAAVLEGMLLLADGGFPKAIEIIDKFAAAVRMRGNNSAGSLGSREKGDDFIQ